jgi:hypothetical protein
LTATIDISLSSFHIGKYSHASRMPCTSVQNPLSHVMMLLLRASQYLPLVTTPWVLLFLQSTSSYPVQICNRVTEICLVLVILYVGSATHIVHILLLRIICWYASTRYYITSFSDTICLVRFYIFPMDDVMLLVSCLKWSSF